MPRDIDDKLFSSVVLVAEQSVISNEADLVEVVLHTLLAVRDQAALARLIVTNFAVRVNSVHVFELKLVRHARDVEGVRRLAVTVYLTLDDTLAAQVEGFFVGEGVELLLRQWSVV